MDGVWPQFIHPYPLGTPGHGAGSYFLVSCRPEPESPFGLYLADRFDNLTRIRELPGYALMEPLPLGPRSCPPVIPDKVDLIRSDAVIFLENVYRGGGLEGVPRGAVKALRVFTYYFGSRGMGGLLGSIGMDGPWDMRRVLGTVPVEADGSACFRVPANLPLAVQPLDDRGQAIQQMRSWFTAMPGEVLSCVGCHESTNEVAPSRGVLALEREPSRIAAWHGPERGFGFAREVQPVLDAHCLCCHDGREPPEDLAPDRTFPDLRGDVAITDWRSDISGNVGVSTVRGTVLDRLHEPDATRAAARHRERHGHAAAPGFPRREHRVDAAPGQGASRSAARCRVPDRLVTWIDMNAPFHGTWAEMLGADRVKPVVERRRELERRFGGPDRDWEAAGPAAEVNALEMKAGYAPKARNKPVAKPTQVQHGLPQETSFIARETLPLDCAPALTGGASPFPDLAPEPGLQSTERLDLGGGVRMVLVPVPAGTFIMGDDRGHPDERPGHEVRIERPFLMSRCEITNAQFACFDPAHDSRRESRHGYQFGREGYPLNAPDQPVVRITWHQAHDFCVWLSKRTGRRIDLPTEAQWEYACRAGSRGDFAFGNLGDDYAKHANLGDRRLAEYAACTAHLSYEGVRILENPGPYDDWVPRDDRCDDGHFLAAPVGSYGANAFGLCDLHGNVWEWTRSTMAPYPHDGADGRVGAADTGVSTRKVVRGGSWYDRPHRARSAYRLAYRSYHRAFNVGFRIVVENSDR